MSRWVLTGSVIRGEGSVGAGRAAFETILYPAATLTLCLLFTGTLADAETADLQVGGKVPFMARTMAASVYLVRRVGLNSCACAEANAVTKNARASSMRCRLTSDCLQPIYRRSNSPFDRLTIRTQEHLHIQL
jgi:hypothetical protein